SVVQVAISERRPRSPSFAMVAISASVGLRPVRRFLTLRATVPGSVTASKGGGGSTALPPVPCVPGGPPLPPPLPPVAPILPVQAAPPAIRAQAPTPRANGDT